MALGANSVHISALRQSTHDELSVDEEEVDQLDSGLDSEEEVDELEEAAPAASASVSAPVSKPRPKKTGDRIPGHTILPATRVENILQGSEAGPHLSKEALYMLSVATEEFIKRLARAGKRIADLEARQLVYYRDVAIAAQMNHEFDFAQDVMPAPLSVTEALERRAAKEKELADADPAIAPSTDYWALPPPSEESLQEEPPAASDTGSSRSKSRSRLLRMNGNGEAEGGSPGRPRVRDTTGRYVPNPESKPSGNKTVPSARRVSVGTRPGSSRIRERASRASEGGHTPSADSPSSANGTSSVSRGGMGPPAPPRPSSSLSNRGTSRGDDVRSAGGYGGHPNGFMDMFGGGGRGTGIADAPGRTIYSAQRATQSNR
ncbi:hypothetical protein FOMPIDRAFT_1057512 [Fomitopsis schrenkii]|uniref:Transcription factor CBF/NF-Y/archaeal histone domain-containing protein n=1 Tax=Fomitopsis schrenkii TaxID=2126942 RepID=S8G4R4_FOMSC|nr:hypothetical protein FOMPIDRAFT_1057512 [Fomitopsis schrenkii]